MTREQADQILAAAVEARRTAEQVLRSYSADTHEAARDADRAAYDRLLQLVYDQVDPAEWGAS